MEKKIELQVLSITNSQAQAGAYAMLLGEIKGKRKLPVIIGPAEAQATALCIKGAKTPRPLTHELLNSCVTALGGTIYRILIYKAQEGIFYSYIYIRKGEEEVLRIDARTSDAIALAVRTNSPIYIYESILEQECLHLDETDELETVQDLGSVDETDTDGINSSQRPTLSLPELEKELTIAIEKENYELAARLRDEIQRFK